MADPVQLSASASRYATLENAREAAKKNSGNEAIVFNNDDKTYSLKKIAETPEEEKKLINDATSNGMEAKANVAKFDPNIVEFSVERTLWGSKTVRTENSASETKDNEDVGSKINDAYIDVTATEVTTEAGKVTKVEGGKNQFATKDDAIAAAKKHDGIEAVVKNADGSFSLYRATQEDIDKLSKNPDYKGKVTAFVVPESKLLGMMSSENVIDIPVKSTVTAPAPATDNNNVAPPVPSAEQQQPAVNTPETNIKPVEPVQEAPVNLNNDIKVNMPVIRGTDTSLSNIYNAKLTEPKLGTGSIMLSDSKYVLQPKIDTSSYQLATPKILEDYSFNLFNSDYSSTLANLGIKQDKPFSLLDDIHTAPSYYSSFDDFNSMFGLGYLDTSTEAAAPTETAEKPAAEATKETEDTDDEKTKSPDDIKKSLSESADGVLKLSEEVAKKPELTDKQKQIIDEGNKILEKLKDPEYNIMTNSGDATKLMNFKNLMFEKSTDIKGKGDLYKMATSLNDATMMILNSKSTDINDKLSKNKINNSEDLSKTISLGAEKEDLELTKKIIESSNQMLDLANKGKTEKLSPEEVKVINDTKTVLYRMKSPDYNLGEHKEDIAALQGLSELAKSGKLNLSKEQLAGLEKLQTSIVDLTVARNVLAQKTNEMQAAVKQTEVQANIAGESLKAARASLADLDKIINDPSSSPADVKKAQDTKKSVETTIGFYESQLDDFKEVSRTLGEKPLVGPAMYVAYGTYFKKLEEARAKGQDLQPIVDEFQNVYKKIQTSFVNKKYDDIILTIAAYGGKGSNAEKAAASMALANKMVDPAVIGVNVGGSATEATVRQSAVSGSGHGTMKAKSFGMLMSDPHQEMTAQDAGRVISAVANVARTNPSERAKINLQVDTTILPQVRTETINAMEYIAPKIQEPVKVPTKIDLRVSDTYFKSKNLDVFSQVGKFQKSTEALAQATGSKFNAQFKHLIAGQNTKANLQIFANLSMLDVLNYSLQNNLTTEAEDAKEQSMIKQNEDINSVVNSLIENISKLEAQLSLSMDNFDASSANIADLLKEFKQIIQKLDIDTRIIQNMSKSRTGRDVKFSKEIRENRERWNSLDAARKELVEHFNKSREVTLPTLPLALRQSMMNVYGTYNIK